MSLEDNDILTTCDTCTCDCSRTPWCAEPFHTPHRGTKMSLGNGWIQHGFSHPWDWYLDCVVAKILT